jgi:hypothetical protein
MSAKPSRKLARTLTILAVFCGAANPLQCEKSLAAETIADKPGANAYLPVEVTLKEMRDELRRLHRASLDLISEVEQRDMVVVGEPLLIQPIPEKAIPHPGTEDELLVLGNALPPRKKWLDLTMSEVEKLVGLLDQEKAALAVPNEKQQALAGSLKELNDILTDVNTHYNNLKPLCAGPTYKNIDIGKEALAIYEDTHKAEKPWQTIVTAVRSH